MNVKKRIEKLLPAVLQYVPYLGIAITKPRALLDMIAFSLKFVNVNSTNSGYITIDLIRKRCYY